jgi:nitroimidazol reductase NimA-like FMN-containing flavoprotein (pyridoxamine 5'-phosphate oxidase superfamily)
MRATGKIDGRFSDPDAEPTSWAEAFGVLERAELYWITTVRPDGRPHVTPLIGVATDDMVYFCTGLEEQKGRNLEHNDQ